MISSVKAACALLSRDRLAVSSRSSDLDTSTIQCGVVAPISATVAASAAPTPIPSGSPTRFSEDRMDERGELISFIT